MSEHCDTCKFWDLVAPKRDPDGLDAGVCRRHAPRAAMSPLKESDLWRNDAVWPTTDENDWCGEFVTISPGPGGHIFVNGLCSCGQRTSDDPVKCPNLLDTKEKEE